MVATSFNTENRTYRQLLGNGLTYRVPPFQRDYSWSDEEWEDLWNDIQSVLLPNGEPAHYMGYLVLQTEDNRNFEIVDGQQRLTTLSLIVLAAMRLLQRLVKENKQAEDNQKRIDQLRASYIGYLDPVTLTASNKLSLNRNNDDYYRNYLVTLKEELPQRGFSASTLTMRRAFEWFENRLSNHIKEETDPGKALAQFIETMSDKLFFTVITVSDELNAYRVFETLNARGVRLSATDLLKNYLFSILARQEEVGIKELERRWELIVGRLGDEKLPEFLRTHWNSRYGFARQSELFKIIRPNVKTPKDVFTLLDGMDEDIDTYLALTQPEASHWSTEFKQNAQILRMFSVQQPYSLLITARRCLGDEDFKKLLNAILIISLRYNIIGSKNPNEQERIYNSVALKIHERKITSIEEILTALKPLYPNDEQFRSDFSTKSMKTTRSRNARIAKYILAKLEKQLGGADIDIDSATYSLEHILPQSPDEGWEAFPDRDLENFIYRLGNMTLLETSLNREISNKSYEEKRLTLQKSKVLLTRKLAEENENWTPERLDAWQRELAKIATATWRISQFD
ncbi:MAG: DUF262 domain-containing protein [Acidobacteria bacterium]|jgi:hypothetical protein|nr:MAG: DUF262 domain-containing protein [Acidobacteriota bacterium]GIU80981.1 MAG: hypothetical protein KatS3mg006_0045 [Pyrinomonadaceae bacterium]